MTDMTDVTGGPLGPRLREAARHYHVPPEPPLDEMWGAVEAAAFDAPAGRRWRAAPRWLRTTVALAAALVLGVGLGRYTAGRAPTSGAETARAVDAPVRQAAPGTDADVGYRLAATQHLGQTVVLLAAFPREARAGRVDRAFATQAGELLSTTRLLLDSPAAEDPELRLLLDDLELVLAQIARLSARRDAGEVDLIREALEHRDVLPRLRSAVAELPLRSGI